MPVPKGSTKTRKPSQVKARQGTLHPELENKSAPSPKHPGIPNAPPYLEPAEQEAWEKFADVLHGSYKILCKEHFALFECLVTAYVGVQWYAAELRKAKAEDKLIVESTRFDKQGNAITTLAKHPAHSAYIESVQQLQQLCGRFGLSPADIGRVSVTKSPTDAPKPEDEFGQRKAVQVVK